MTIRLAQDKDYAQAARLHRTTIRAVNSKDYPEDIINIWSAQTTAKRFRESAHLCKRWVAVEKDKIIGFCDHNFECQLWGLYVHKDFLGKGVGSRLLKKAEASLKSQGCKKVVIKSTVTAKNFYEKHGYTVVEKTVHPIKDKKVPIYIMEKILD